MKIWAFFQMILVKNSYQADVFKKAILKMYVLKAQFFFFNTRFATF